MEVGAGGGWEVLGGAGEREREKKEKEEDEGRQIIKIRGRKAEETALHANERTWSVTICTKVLINDAYEFCKLNEN